MKKTILITAALACSALWAVAQTSTMPSSQSGAGQTSSSAASSGSPITVDGCLAGSAGSYMVKDKATGTTYNLAGDTSKLAAHVGHELQITGTTSSANASAASGAASSATPSSAGPSSTGSASGQQTLNMTAAKMVSSTCSAQ